MNSKLMHTIKMYQSLNSELSTLIQFFVMMGFAEDEQIDSIILVGSQEEEDNSEWKGLTQTMRVMIYTKLDEIKSSMMYQLTTQNDEIKNQNDEIKNQIEEIKNENAKVSAQLNDKVEQTNRNVDLVREEMAEIKTLIQQLNKAE